MIKTSLTSILALSLVATTPSPVRADLKDVLIGGVIGAAINEGVRRDQAKKRSTSTRKVVRKSAPSLNSQFSFAERTQIQSSLNAMGYSVGTVDGVLGRNSRAAIGQFQATLGEPRTGQLTRAQYAALSQQAGFAAPTLVVDRGLQRNEVILLQQGLQRLGYYRGGIDGSKGPGTRGATTAFLASQGRAPGQTTQVQSVVLAATAAGFPVPPYLMQEAQQQFAAANATPQFGGQPTQQMAGFGQPPVQQGFGAQQGTGFGGQQTAGFGQAPLQQGTGFGQAPVPQGNGFGAPQPATPFGSTQSGTVAAAQPAPLFGAPAPQQATGTFGAQPQQGGTATGIFAPQPQQQQPQAPAGTQPLFAPQPAPQQGGAGTLFASGGGTQAPQQANMAQPQSTLDVFQPTAPVQQATAPAAQPAATGQQPLVTFAQPQQQTTPQQQVVAATPQPQQPAAAATPQSVLSVPTQAIQGTLRAFSATPTD